MPQETAIDIILQLICDNLGYEVKIAPLPPGGGISMQIQPGRNDGSTLDKQRQSRTLTMLFLAKDRDQQAAYTQLCSIGNLLSKTADFPTSDDVQILSAAVSTETGLVDKVGDQWIYSMVIDVKIAF